MNKVEANDALWWKVTRADDVEALRALLDAGADPNAESNDAGRTALFYAKQDALTLLLERGASPNAQDSLGKTPLIYRADAPGGDDVEALCVLLDWGADMELEDNTGNTALVTALDGWQIEAAALLLERGADITEEVRFVARFRDSLRPWFGAVALLKAVEQSRSLDASLPLTPSPTGHHRL